MRSIFAIRFYLFISLALYGCAKPEGPVEVVTPTYSLILSSGSNQNAIVGTTLSRAFVATILDSKTGKPVPHIGVEWSVEAGGGTFENKFTRSDVNGNVVASYKLGTVVGTNTVSAKIEGESTKVTFTAIASSGSPDPTKCSITGTGPIPPDGVNYSTISITIKDSNGNPIAGTVPTFGATGSTNDYGTCSPTDALGLSSCTLKSTTQETKILSMITPIAVVGGTVTFAPLGPSIANSTISGTGPVVANGASTSTVTITLKDPSNIPVAGVVPTFSATDSGATNTYGSCTASNASGISTCTLASTKAQIKTLSITSPVSKTGGTVSFIPGPPSSATSTITGTGPISSNGVQTSTISIQLKDANGNPVTGASPTFSASGTGNTYGACSSTDSNGLSTCTFASTTPETKTLSVTTPISFSGDTVLVTPVTFSTANSSIVGTGPVTADGASTSSVTITLIDINNYPVMGMVPTFSATDTGSTNTYGVCSATNSSGVSNCTLASAKAEIKTLALVGPVSKSDGTVMFIPGAASVATSTITGSGPVVADGVASSTITVTLLDANSNAISGVAPTFNATDTGSKNSYGGCSVTDSSGVSTCSLTSTKAESKTLSLLTPASKVGGSVNFVAGTPSSSTSTISGTGPVPPDGTSTSTITIGLYDAFANPVSGQTPTFSATNTGGSNTYGACSVSDSSGISTCTLASTKTETKTLYLSTPVAVTGSTVVFQPGAPSATHSSITGSGPVTADGSNNSTITITLRDSSNLPVPNLTPTFSATDTGSANTYGSCSVTDDSGISTCSLSSTKAQVKTLSITSPVSKTGGSVTFVAGTPSASTSNITGTGPVTANGSSTSTITIVLYDAYNNPVSGSVPLFSATDTGSTNNYGTCSSTDSSGVSTCTLSSTKAETKTLSIATPVSKAGGTVSFVAGAASATNSTITGTGPVTANGSSTSTVTITLLDANSNPVSGQVPTFSATNTGSTNSYGTCSSTDSSGISTCTLSSTKAETKTLSIATPVSKAGGTVSFVAGTISATNSTITGTGPVTANGSSTSTVTITLLDANSNPVSGQVPTFSATNTGSTNSYGVCTSSDSSGVSTCTLSSTKAETKTLSIATPVTKAGGTVSFVAGAASATNSTITGTGPVTANGSSTSTVTITLLDANSNPVAGTVPTFSATNTGSTNSYGTCSSSDVSGVSTCTLSSTKAETKTLSIATPVSKTGGTVSFIAGAASATTSTITGTGPVTANGSSTSTVTITLLDANNNPVSGTVPTFSATNTGSTNSYGACTSSDSSGVSTCTLSSTKAESKTLSIATPVSKTGGTVSFVAGAASATNSTITGTGPVTANGSSTSTVTITLLDANNNPISGTVPTFSATNTGSTNNYGTCSSSNSSGISTCTLSSTKAETKTLSIATPVTKAGGTVSFVAGAASAANSTITGTGPVTANGSATSTITITLIDAYNNPLVGVTPTFAATDTASKNVYGACSSTSSSGVSTCTLKSTKAETKTLSVTAPISFSGGSVIFQ